MTQPWTSQAVASSLNMKFEGRRQEYKSIRWEAEDKRGTKEKAVCLIVEIGDEDGCVDTGTFQLGLKEKRF